MEPAVRCGTCRWCEVDPEASAWLICFRDPCVEHRRPHGMCGEWAHDPRRYRLVCGEAGMDVEGSARRGVMIPDGDRRIEDRKTGFHQSVRWPWEEEVYEAGPNAHVEGADA